MPKQIKQTFSQSIIEILRSYDVFIIDKWKARNFLGSGNSIKFDINVNRFSGEVIISQNSMNKSYFITLKKGKKTHHRITDIADIKDVPKILNDYIEDKQ